MPKPELGAAATESVISALVGVGGDVNARTGKIQRIFFPRGRIVTHTAWTPLMYAAQYVEDVDIVRTLLGLGANRQYANVGNYSACSVVRSWRDPDLENQEAIETILCPR